MRSSETMYTCDNCRDLLWDYLYDLLDGAEAQGIQAHLATCEGCKGQLLVAQSEIGAIAGATEFDITVPPFVAPEEVLSIKSAGKLPSWQWAAAAAVLLAVGLSFGLYRHGLSSREQELAAAQERLAEIQRHRDQSLKSLAEEGLVLVHNVSGKLIRLQVWGPASYHSGTPVSYYILTTDLSGKFITTKVRLRIFGTEDRVLFDSRELPCEGSLPVVLPEGLELKTENARLVVSAEGVQGRVEVEGNLDAAAASSISHIAFNKPLYRPGELVLFRSLTLDRFTLKPLDKDPTIRFTLYDPKGKAVQTLFGRMHEHAIGGGQFLLADNYSEGEYTLEVSSEDKHFAPQRRGFLVQSPSRYLKTLKFNRDSYRPGETIESAFQISRRDNGEALADRAVSATLVVDGKTTESKDLKTDAKGAVQVHLALPASVEKGDVQLKLVVDDIGRREELVRDVPVEVSTVNVQFFPESGDLVAGLPNRLHYRARTPLGQPVSIEGRVVDSRKNLIAEIQGERGVISFTPAVGERYALEVKGGRIDLPTPRPDGVVIHAQHGAQEPEISIHQVGHEGQPLVVAAICRGRVVAQESIVGTSKVRLNLPAAAQGVIRLAVLDPRANHLQPLAERWLYRLPTERLQLTIQPEQVGERVRLAMGAANEKQETQPAWLFVSVVNKEVLDRVQDPQDRDAAAHFHMLNDLSVMGEAPATPAELDLFLAMKAGRKPVSMLRLDNRAESEQAFAVAMAELKNRSDRQQKELAESEEQQTAAVLAAGDSLNRFQDRMSATFGLIGWTLAGVLVLWLGWAIARAQIMHRPGLIGALGCVGIAVALAFAGSFQNGEIATVLQRQMDDLAWNQALPAGRGLDLPRESDLLVGVTPRLKDDSRHARATAILPPAKTLAPVISSQGKAPPPLPVSPFIFRKGQQTPVLDTVLWHPRLEAKNGVASVLMDLPEDGGEYFIRVFAHTADGRLGTAELKLDSRK